MNPLPRIFLSLSVVFLSSCNSQPHRQRVNQSEEPVVGTWVYSFDEDRKLNIKSDNSWEIVRGVDGKLFAGKWEAVDEKKRTYAIQGWYDGNEVLAAEITANGDLVIYDSDYNMRWLRR